MNGVNQVMLFGTVGADPEMKTLGERRVCTFRLATNDSYTDKTGEKKETTEWHSVESWNFIADAMNNYVKKGTNLIVFGKIKTDCFDDKDVAGKKVYRTKIVMDDFRFVPGGAKHMTEQQQPMQQPMQQPVQQPAYQQPVQQPNYQQPVQQPSYQQSVQQPNYQQPVQQPAQQPNYQQPIQQQPVQQRPIQQPVQQAQQQVGVYMNDAQVIANMNNGADDLPF